ncbi:MAG: NINE protein [Lachnospirales bacterium]
MNLSDLSKNSDSNLEVIKPISESTEIVNTQASPEQHQPLNNTKFCKHCGKVIDKEVVVCIHCGKQVEELKTSGATPMQVVNHVNNSNTNTNTNTNTNVNGAFIAGRVKNKWVAFLLCLFIGFLGAHKFYEGKMIFGILYLFTFGLFGIGVIIDLILILLKPNPYFV